MGKIGVIITMDVPKSVWFITMIVGINTKINGIMIDLNCFISIVWSDKYLAKAKVVKTFENSLVCIAKGRPIFNQRYVPTCGGPKNGRITIIIPKIYNG